MEARYAPTCRYRRYCASSRGEGLGVEAALYGEPSRRQSRRRDVTFRQHRVAAVTNRRSRDHQRLSVSRATIAFVSSRLHSPPHRNTRTRGTRNRDEETSRNNSACQHPGRDRGRGANPPRRRSGCRRAADRRDGSSRRRHGLDRHRRHGIAHRAAERLLHSACDLDQFGRTPADRPRLHWRRAERSSRAAEHLQPSQFHALPRHSRPKPPRPARPRHAAHPGPRERAEARRVRHPQLRRVTGHQHVSDRPHRARGRRHGWRLRRLRL